MSSVCVLLRNLGFWHICDLWHHCGSHDLYLLFLNLYIWIAEGGVRKGIQRTERGFPFHSSKFSWCIGFIHQIFIHPFDVWQSVGLQVNLAVFGHKVLRLVLVPPVPLPKLSSPGGCWTCFPTGLQMSSAQLISQKNILSWKYNPRIPRTLTDISEIQNKNLVWVSAFSILLIIRIIYHGNDFYCWYIWEIIFPLSFLDFLYLPLILIIYCLTRGTQAAHAVRKIRGAFIPQGYCLL